MCYAVVVSQYRPELSLKDAVPMLLGCHGYIDQLLAAVKPPAAADAQLSCSGGARSQAESPMAKVLISSFAELPHLNKLGSCTRAWPP